MVYKMEINLDLLSIQNPWWKGRNLKYDPILDAYKRRPLKFNPKIFSGLDMEKENIFLVSGGRGTGKTTSVKLYIKDLIEKKNIDPKNIFYYSCHNIISNGQLSELVKLYISERKKKTEDRLYIFIDEITLVKNWDEGMRHLKDAGKLKNASIFFITSNQEKITPRLKAENIKAEPLHFRQFLNLFNENILSALNEKKFKTDAHILDFYLDVYLLTGGYLKNINSYKKKGSVHETAYFNLISALNLDIAKSGRDINLLRQILEEIILNFGEPVGYKTIANKTKARTHLTIAGYLETLEKMFALDILYQGERASSRPKKIFFEDPFQFWTICAYVYGAVDSWKFSIEHLHENKILCALIKIMVYGHLKKSGQNISFWRDSIKNLEIDFLIGEKKKIPVLVRYKNRPSEKDFKILERLKYKEGIIITKEEMDLAGKIKKIPLTYFLLFYKM